MLLLDLQKLDLRGTRACEWPADLVLLARRPGLELRLDASPHKSEPNEYYYATFTFDADEGGLPWEVERRKHQAAIEAYDRQRKRALPGDVAQSVATLAALEAQLQALHELQVAAQEAAQAAGQPWQPVYDALQVAQQVAHLGQELQHLLGMHAGTEDLEQKFLMEQHMGQALAGVAALVQQQQLMQEQLQQQLQLHQQVQELQQLQQLQ
ncbi:hypothetical protein ABPG77_007364 [Micractinium sp. CCAP 211/92]